MPVRVRSMEGLGVIGSMPHSLLFSRGECELLFQLFCSVIGSVKAGMRAELPMIPKRAAPAVCGVKLVLLAYFEVRRVNSG